MSQTSEPGRIESIFADLVDLPTEERRIYLDRARSSDGGVQEAVKSMLESYDHAAKFFEVFASALSIASLSEALDEFIVRDPYALVGTTFSHYRIEEHLGGGGMGVVYRARDIDLLRDVAIKVLPPDMARSETAVRRFRHEASAVSSLDHPNIATVFEIGKTDAGLLYIVMAFYDGETLNKKLERGPLSAESVVSYTSAVAEGLAEAHRRGVIHRDIKPANILVTREGTVKLLDFGVAKIADLSSLTPEGNTVGTLAYMSPEQARGESVDVRTDVWSLGVVMYEMLTGRPPFDAEFKDALVYQILNVQPENLSALAPNVPDSLCHVVSTCLQKKRADRYSNLEDLVTALRQAASPVVEERLMDKKGDSRRSERDRSGARSSKSYRIRVAGLALLASAALVLVWQLTGGRSGTPPGSVVNLAVLPFANLGADQMLVDGLLYNLSSRLASIEESRGGISLVPTRDVVAESVSTYRDAATKFGVGHVLTGSVQRLKNGLQLKFDLVDTEDGRLVDSRDLQVEDSRIGSVEDRAVESLLELLSVDVDSDTRELLAAGRARVAAAYDYYTRARGYMERFEDEANIDAAISLLGVAIKEDSLYALAHAALGEAYLLKFRATDQAAFMDQAIESGRKAVALDPDLAQVRVALGLTFLEQGSYEKAEAEYYRALVTEPRSAAAYYQLGRVYYNQGHLDKAESSYRTATELKPDYWRYHNALGIFYHRIGQHNKAIEPFQWVIVLRPDNPWGYNNLGAQYHQLGMLDKALEQYQKAARANPNARAATAHALRNVAGLHYTRDEFHLAVQGYLEAVAVDSTSLEGWDNLGNSYYWADAAESATVAWEKVIELATERLDINAVDRDALNYLAEAHAKLGNARAAKKTLRRLMSLERLEANDYVLAAKVYEIHGQRDSALWYVKAALDAGSTLGPIEASVWLDNLRSDESFLAIVDGRSDSTPFRSEGPKAEAGSK